MNAQHTNAYFVSESERYMYHGREKSTVDADSHSQMTLKTSRRGLAKESSFTIKENLLLFLALISLILLAMSVNTGFGGGANTRNSNVNEPQQILIRELPHGILAADPTTGATFASSDTRGYPTF